MNARVEWLLPFAGRNACLATNVNVLMKSERVYVMDNHRCALWCWWQHISGLDAINLLHIDFHFDTLWGEYNPWPNSFRPAHRTDLAGYLDATTPDDMHLYRWDNFVAAFLSLEGDGIKRKLFVGVGDTGQLKPVVNVERRSIAEAEGTLQEAIDSAYRDGVPWLIDIDLDAFTICGADGSIQYRCTDAKIKDIGRLVRVGYEANAFQAVTVALSPENTGGWTESERLLGHLTASWPIKFELPSQ